MRPPAAVQAKSAVEGVDLLILAVKPQNVHRLFEEIGGSISPDTVVSSAVLVFQPLFVSAPGLAPVVVTVSLASWL